MKFNAPLNGARADEPLGQQRGPLTRVLWTEAFEIILFVQTKKLHFAIKIEDINLCPANECRDKKIMEKETINPALNLAMRILYQVDPPTYLQICPAF